MFRSGMQPPSPQIIGAPEVHALLEFLLSGEIDKLSTAW